MDFSRLPQHCISSVLKQTSLYVFVRIRKTCRTLDKLVEKQRNSLRIFSPCNRPILLRIRIDSEHAIPVFSVFYNKAKSKLISDYVNIKKKNFIGIKDPYRELSGLHMNMIIMNTSVKGEPDLESNEQSSYAVRHKIAFVDFLTLLQSLRLSCKWMVYNSNNFHIEKSAELLKLFVFKQFRFEGTASMEQLRSWNIRHCVSICVQRLPRATPELCSSFEKCTDLVIGFENDYVNELVNFIETLIDEWKINRKSRGILGKLQIYANGISLAKDELGFTTFCRGRNKKYNCKASISKVEVQGGVVYFLFEPNFCVVSIRDVENDEDVIADFMQSQHFMPKRKPIQQTSFFKRLSCVNGQ